MLGDDVMSEWIVVPEKAAVDIVEHQDAPELRKRDLIASFLEGGVPDPLDDDADRQVDEAVAMAAMYGSDFSQDMTNVWIFRQHIWKGVSAEMKVTLPQDYPSSQAPELTLDIPGIRNLQDVQRSFLQEYVLDNEVVFTWAERFQELCRSSSDKLLAVSVDHDTERATGLRSLGLELAPRASYHDWTEAYYPYRIPFPRSSSGPSKGAMVRLNCRRQEESDANRREKDKEQIQQAIFRKLECKRLGIA